MKKNNLEQKIKRRKTFFKVSFFLLCILSASVIILSSSYFKIKSIQVVNNYLVSEKEINALVQLTGKNIFTINTGETEKKIKYNPYIESIEVVRKLPNKITIRVNEKKIMGMIKYKNTFVHVDRNGKMIQIIDKFPNCKIPLIDGITIQDYEPGKLITDNEVQLKSLEAAFLINDYTEFNGLIYSINVQDPYKITYKTKDETTLCIGDWDNVEYKLKCAYSIINNETVKGNKGYVEINSDGTAIYKKN